MPLANGHPTFFETLRDWLVNLYYSIRIWDRLQAWNWTAWSGEENEVARDLSKPI